MNKQKVTLEELLTDLGIRVRNEQGNYRTVFEVMEDLSNAWNVLSNGAKDKVRNYLTSLV